MITFIAHFTVPPTNAAAFEELLTYVATMSNTEPGVVYYGFARSVDEAARIPLSRCIAITMPSPHMGRPTGSPNRCPGSWASSKACHRSSSTSAPALRRSRLSSTI